MQNVTENVTRCLYNVPYNMFSLCSLEAITVSCRQLVLWSKIRRLQKILHTRNRGDFEVMTKATGNEYRLILICVDSYDDFVLQGRYYNSSRKEGIYFQSATELVLSIEQLLDQLQFPQAFYRIRSFSDSGVVFGDIPERDWSNRGRIATFQLKVLFRQNVSWQGTIRWVETKKEISFRSVLELLSLVDSALRDCQQKKEA